MAIPDRWIVWSSGFLLNRAEPLDLKQRLTTAERLLIDPVTQAWLWMRVYDVDLNIRFQLVWADPSVASNWTEIPSSILPPWVAWEKFEFTQADVVSWFVNINHNFWTDVITAEVLDNNNQFSTVPVVATSLNSVSIDVSSVEPLLWTYSVNIFGWEAWPIDLWVFWNTLFVSTDWNINNAIKWDLYRPYPSPETAIAAAVAWDTIRVLKWDYVITSNLAKDWVNRVLDEWSVLRRATQWAIFSDGWSDMVFSITGYGTISGIWSSLDDTSAVVVRWPNTVVTIDGLKELSHVTSRWNGTTVRVKNTNITVESTMYNSANLIMDNCTLTNSLNEIINVGWSYIARNCVFIKDGDFTGYVDWRYTRPSNQRPSGDYVFFNSRFNPPGVKIAYFDNCQIYANTSFTQVPTNQNASFFNNTYSLTMNNCTIYSNDPANSYIWDGGNWSFDVRLNNVYSNVTTESNWWTLNNVWGSGITLDPQTPDFTWVTRS